MNESMILLFLKWWMFQPSSSGRFRGGILFSPAIKNPPSFGSRSFESGTNLTKQNSQFFSKSGTRVLGVVGGPGHVCFFETTKLAWLKTEVFLENAGLNLKNNKDDCSIVLPKFGQCMWKVSHSRTKLLPQTKEQKQGMLCPSNTEIATSVKGLTESASFWRINAITCSPFTAGKGHCITLKITSNIRIVWSPKMGPIEWPLTVWRKRVATIQKNSRSAKYCDQIK